jgi:hypothetical protein
MTVKSVISSKRGACFKMDVLDCLAVVFLVFDDGAVGLMS